MSWLVKKNSVSSKGVLIRLNRRKQVYHCPYRFQWVQGGPNGSKSVPIGPYLFKYIQNGPEGLLLVPTGPVLIWSQLVQTSPCWSKCLPHIWNVSKGFPTWFCFLNESKLVQMGPIWSKLVLISSNCPYLFILYLLWPKWFILVAVSTNWFEVVPITNKWPKLVTTDLIGL